MWTYNLIFFFYYFFLLFSRIHSNQCCIFSSNRYNDWCNNYLKFQINSSTFDLISNFSCNSYNWISTRMFHYPNNSNHFEPNDSNNQRSIANLDNLRAYLFCPISLLPHHTMEVYITTYIRLHIHTLEAKHESIWN